jgi:hypothetical protein
VLFRRIEYCGFAQWGCCGSYFHYQWILSAGSSPDSRQGYQIDYIALNKLHTWNPACRLAIHTVFEPWRSTVSLEEDQPKPLAVSWVHLCENGGLLSTHHNASIFYRLSLSVSTTTHPVCL